VKVALLERPGVVTIAERPRPSPGPHDVLVEIQSVGICGSDVHYFRHGRIGRYVVERPMVLGHECSGRIVEAGATVDQRRIGERVAVEPGVPCRRCRWCKTGHYNLCPFVEFLATPPVDGGLAEYLVVPDDFAHPLPDNVSMTGGALVEPTAVAVHAARLARAQPGERAMIFGAGPVGLLLLQVLQSRGLDDVQVVDPDPRRQEWALRLGASGAHDGDVDVGFDASGHPDAMAGVIAVVRRGGRAIWIGLPAADDISVRASAVIDKELELRGCFRYANAHAEAITLIARGAVEAETLVSHRFPLQRAAQALATAGDRTSDAMKVVVEGGQMDRIR
jgi:L-iditol 2-dehydrogenase